MQSDEETKDSEQRAIVNLARALEEGALDQDPFVQQYRAKRMEEMKEQAKLGSQRYMYILDTHLTLFSLSLSHTHTH